MTKTDIASTAETNTDAEGVVPPTEAEPPASSSMIEDPRTVRILQVLVVVMGVILVAGFIAVIARIAYLVSRTGEPATQPSPIESRIPTDGAEGTASAGAPLNATLDLPEGAEIVSVDPLTVGPERTPHIFVRYRTTTGQRQAEAIAVFDGTTGALLRVLKLGRPSAVD